MDTQNITQPNESPASGHSETTLKGSTGKASAKSSPKTAGKSALFTNAFAINEAWAKEVLEVAGYPTAIADALSPAVAQAVSDEVCRKFNAAKIGRIVKKAVGTLCKK